MGTYQEPILYLTHEDVRRCLEDLDPVAIIADALALHDNGEVTLPDESYLAWTNAENEFARSLAMSAYLGGDLATAGTKIINGKPANIKRGLPRASGLTLLFDVDTARVLSIMEGAHISALRTASVSALAANLLQGPAVETLAIIGAGVLAETHIEVLFPRLPALRQILVYDYDVARSQSLCERIQPRLREGIQIKVVDQAETAIRPAQLIIPVTTTTTGYIAYDWLQPGAILVNVSLDDPLPEVFLHADKIVVDDWQLIVSDNHRILGRLHRDGVIGGPDLPEQEQQKYRRVVYSTIGALVNKRHAGRSNADEIILVNPFGLALEDIAIATYVYRNAKKLGLGLQLPR